MFIQTPLYIQGAGLAKEQEVKQSIDSFLSLLLCTPCNNCKADSNFGFVFNNLRFEIFNENEGTVYDSFEQVHDNNNFADLYVKKISGSSKNLNTFASELKTAIETYEKRLSNVAVSMTYVREAKNIFVTVKGYITAIEKDYLFNSHINIWN